MNTTFAVPPRRGQRNKSLILPPFNGGNVFQIVSSKDGSIGVVRRRGKTHTHVWVGNDLESTTFLNDELVWITLPEVPSQAFETTHATIGGIGKHIRWNVVLPNRKCQSAASLHVGNVTDVEEFKEFVEQMIRPFGLCKYEFKKAENDSTYESIVEVPECKNIAIVAAALHCSEFTARPTATHFVSGAKLAPERYDRSEHMWWNQEQKVAGPLRDVHRWDYGFIPSSWETIPFTWQSLCENINVPVSKVDILPLPLRDYYLSHCAERAEDGAEKIRIQRLRGTPCVTCRLSEAQNKQLLTATYWSYVAPFNKDVTEYCHLIRFRYMLHGYTSREIGGYRQTALHLGHGAKIREFKNKPQYRRENLSIDMLNHIYRTDGSISGTGFKGTRGKYGHTDFPRYEPVKRMKRTMTHEKKMRAGTSNCFAEYRGA